jgi:S-formylglutathione hydrolase FrmB
MLRSIQISLFILLAAFGAANSIAASDSGVRLREIRHDSASLRREVPVRVLLPDGYESASTRFPVLILLHGLGGDYRNWVDKTVLTSKSQGLGLIIVMPDGGNSWYTDSATEPKDAYESYLIKELIPYIDSNFRSVPRKESRMIAGLSMGGFGALKLALKHPTLFSVAGSFSGALDAPLRDVDNPFLRPSIERVFGRSDDPRRKSDEIFSLVEKVTEQDVRELPFLYLDCGSEDWLIGTNRDFSQRLLSKKIPHEFRQLPGRHDWRFWNAQVGQFLTLIVDRGIVSRVDRSKESKGV